MFLERERARGVDAIMTYPPPIPACDLHFNRLLEQRTAICLELRQFRAWPPDQRATDAGPAFLRGLIRQSDCLDEDEKCPLLEGVAPGHAGADA